MFNNIENTSSEEDVRYLASYSLVEAAFYLRLSQSTLRAWVGKQDKSEALITPVQERPLALSFINLVEAYVLASMRRGYGISTNKIRRAMKRASKNHPNYKNLLAGIDFETDGVFLYLREEDFFSISTGKKQGVFEEMVKQYMRRIERDPEGLPVRLYPFSGAGEPDEPKSILIDPRISFGRPVLHCINIPVDTIAERFQAGEPIEELAKDYDCEKKEIEEAIRCQLWGKAA